MLKELKDYFKFKTLSADITSRAARNQSYSGLNPYLVLKPKLRTLRLQTDAVVPCAVECPIDGINELIPGQVGSFLKNLLNKWNKAKKEKERDVEYNELTEKGLMLLFKLSDDIQIHYKKIPKWINEAQWDKIQLMKREYNW